ncbi:pPIWI_RE module domain-containing protein [Aerosakkonemataceae cyanobacterium BLCC-F50]|uniref:PPIWI_RE module domain-containing protein n=1 Tax=Floridaenema flaviceps BLCC-F50 TaxID=3153642 RepID=A0ABV4XTG7_9CYAN
MAFKNILLGAWELNQDVEYNLFSLIVPTAWQQVAKSLAQARVKLVGKGYPSVPVYSLDPLINASFPNIIQTMRNGWKYPSVPWILATETADISYLPDLIKDWLREEFNESLGDDEVESKLNTLDNEAWHWEKEPTNYSIWHQPENRNFLDVRFQALPDYLAKEFLKNPTICFEGNVQYQLTFYHVLSLDKGSELMSWPPQRVPLIKRKEKKDLEVGEAYISFIISFKLQTVPWRNQPIIYHQLSIRQWIEKPFEKFPYQSTTAYIGDNRRWLDGIEQPFCFIPLPLKQKGREPRWSKAISELLKINDSPLPEPNNLAGEPKYHWSEFGEETSGIQVAIVYNNYWGKLPCLRGVSPKDLASLDQAIQNKIEQESFPLRRVGNAVKISGTYIPFFERGKSKKTDDKSPKKRDHLSTPMLRPSLAASAVFRIKENSPHTILILWETQECRDALIAEICEVLNLSQKGEPQIYKTLPEIQGEETLYESPLGSLRIKTQHVQDLTQKLDLEHPSVKGKSRQQQRINLLNERIHKITSFLPETDGKLSGALIEIRPKKSFFPPESDPKLALRIGVMQAGYVNQHIHPLTAQNKKGEEYKTRDAANRVQKAVSDLLRQFGILPAPLIDPQKDGIDSNLWLTCFYVLRRTRKTTASDMPSTVALMVRVNAVTGIVQVTTPSLFLTQGWVSYPVGLGYLITEKWDSDSYIDETTLDSSEEQWSKEKRQEQQRINKFVTDCLRDCLNTSIEPEKPSRVLFMAEAQNARKMLTWLQNPQLPANALPDELKRYMIESEQSRLLMVRLRVATDGEVPVGIVKGSPGSRISAGGVFCWQDVCDGEKAVLYLSIRRLLTTEQDVLRQSQSRLDNGSRQAANPRLLEIAVVHSPEIDPDKLACFVHHLRDRWPYFADDVSVPFPFPFASLAYEYAVSAKDTVKLNGFEDSEDSEESLE